MSHFSARNKFAIYKPVLEDSPGWLRISFCNQILPWLYVTFAFKRFYQLFCQITRTSQQYTGDSESACRDEIQKILLSCPWYNFYDFIELSGLEVKAQKPHFFSEYQNKINELFDNGQIGWRLDADAKLVRQIPVALNEKMIRTLTGLMKDFAPASGHYQKSINFAYSRPADPENSIKEIVSALESVGRAIYSSANTLGDVIKAMRNEQIFPSMLLNMMEKFYGYANSEPAVRHGASTPSTVLQSDAELCLTIGTGLIQYLLSRKRPDVFVSDITELPPG
jgi:hypothetical protein